MTTQYLRSFVGNKHACYLQIQPIFRENTEKKPINRVLVGYIGRFAYQKSLRHCVKSLDMYDYSIQWL